MSIRTESTTLVHYSIETLDNLVLEVDFARGIGYQTHRGGPVFESMQALLSERSLEYRRAFANKISLQLTARLAAAIAPGPLLSPG